MSTTTVKSSDKRSLESLYSGKGAIDFVGRSKTWYMITAGLILVCLLSFVVRGFNLSIDFEGGTKMSMPAGDLVVEQVEGTFVEATGVTPELTQIVGAGDSRTLEINSEFLSDEQINNARQAIYEKYQPLDGEGKPSPDAIGDSTVSESWGSTITERMILSMVIFLLVASAYVALRLQRNMAIAAMAALLIDGILIMGIYSLFGLEISPAMIIGLLTVLTFSIYDTVIVFDKVKENTDGILDSRRSTYAEQANLAVNQTVVRSISTSVISALPIIALLIVAVWLLGVGTLQDLALIQLIGVVEGVISSLFLATPFLVSLTNRQKKYKEHNERVAKFRASKSGEAIDGDGDDAHDVELEEKRKIGALKQREVAAEPQRTTTSWRPNQR